MPTPSSSFSNVTPLPPRVVSIRNAIFDAPDETGLSVAVPTTYALYTASTEPNSAEGDNGDWYIWVSAAAVKTYRKVTGTWTLVSTISGGGGGGGGDLSGVTITSSTFSNGTITGTTITTSTLVGPIVTAGVFTSPTITNPSITGGTITSTHVTGLPSPTLPTDAATKQYVDGVAQGFEIHTECVAATTLSNINLAGGAPDDLDGVTLALNDRVLVKDQTDPLENGIYEVATLGTGSNGIWTRTTDADTGHELDSAYVLISEGTTNGGTSWVVSGAPEIGTDPIIWLRFFAVSSIPASIITGSIVASQIGSVNAGAILGTITAGQIGSVNASTISGTISASQIGSVNASSIVGGITSSQITSVSATAISGVISAGQIGSVNATTITGVIVTSQLADQILNTQRLIASDISVVRRLTSLPALPNSDYPAGSLVINTTNKTLYQNVANVWQVVTASSNVVGTLTANDIASVNANSIVGLIIASQISSVSATSIVGSITSGQIASVSASVIQGVIDASHIGNINASSIVGSITSSQIGSVSASVIQGTISSSQISSVSATSITGTISSSQIGSVNASTIVVGSLGANSISTGSSNQLTAFATGQISIGTTGGPHFISVCTGTTSSVISEWMSGNGGKILINAFSTSLSPNIQCVNNAGQTTLTIGPGVSGVSPANIGLFNPSTGFTGSVGIDTSNRLRLQTTSAHSIVFNTSGSDRWFVGSDGHFKSNGGYLMKVSSDGWGPKMSDGGHTIEFQWGATLRVRIDSSSEFNVSIS